MVVPSVRIRSRAPLRLGLGGGGTDVSPYSDEYGGAVLNATIDRFAFTCIQPSVDGVIHFIATDMGVNELLPLDISALNEAKLKLHAAVYRRMINDFGNGVPLPINIQTLVDAPAGSGLGSSSALVVSLVEAFRTLLNLPLGPYEIARLAYQIERVDLHLSGGKQDQYAAVFGGINYTEFLANDVVVVNPLRVSQAIHNELESSLIVCFSGVSRRSATIIDLQRKGMREKKYGTIESFHQLKADALKMKQALLVGDITQMANILDHSWREKQKTAPGIATCEINTLYDAAMKAGALAGKVSGAGGGGFIMFIVPPEKRQIVIKALNDAGGQAQGAQFTAKGVESWTVPNCNS